MKTKLLFYSLSLLLAVAMFYGFNVKDHPNTSNLSSTNELLPSDLDHQPGIVTSGSCSYSWAAQTPGTSNVLLTVSAVSDQIGWASGLGPTVVKTINGGTTWTSATGTGITGDIYNIYAWDANNALVTTTPGATFIYKTTNGGTTWTQSFTQAGGFIDAIEMVSLTDGYAVGDPVGGKWTVLKTTDGGSSWARMATEPTQIGAELGWNNSFLIIGTHMWFGTSIEKVYHSTDLGLTWSSGATTGTVDTYALHFNNTSDGLVGSAAMVKTTNGGSTYSSTVTPGDSNFIFAIEGNGTDWWATRTDSLIYYSSNQGASWSTVYEHPDDLVQFLHMDFAIINGCPTGWAVGFLSSGLGTIIAKMSSDAPLPVELASFTAVIYRNNVTLNWSTLVENNNSGFDVERKLSSSTVWTKVANVASNGNSNELKNYTFSERINTGVYNYRLKQIDFNGNFEYFNLSNEVVVGLPTTFKLSQNYPNPFNPSTKIDYDLPYDGNVNIVLFDISGREVATLVNEIKSAGYNSVTFNASDLASGIYYYKLMTDNFSETKKMTLLK